MGAYLDNSATTMVCKQVVEKINLMLTENYGNPSSLHEMGIAAELEVKKARGIIARAIGAAAEEIVFCSGGTEANNMALIPAARGLRRKGRRIVATAVEHASVGNALMQLEKEGFEVIYLQPTREGYILEDQFFDAIDDQTILVSVMLCNNETGAIFPVNTIRRAVRCSGAPALIHCDAVQAFMKIPFHVSKLDVDLLTVSAHKIHGPKGIGALYIKKGTRIPPLLYGGAQEGGQRAGTENTPFISGFGAAVQACADKDYTKHIQEMQRTILSGLCKIPRITINSPSDGIPYIINFSLRGVPSEPLLHFLEQRGIYVSSGSACSKNTRSHVLTAQGLDNDIVDSALRVSLSRFNTLNDCDMLLSAVAEAARTLRRR